MRSEAWRSLLALVCVVWTVGVAVVKYWWLGHSWRLPGRHSDSASGDAVSTNLGLDTSPTNVGLESQLGLGSSEARALCLDAVAGSMLGQLDSLSSPRQVWWR